MATGWGRIPLFQLGELGEKNGYVITAIYYDEATKEIVIEYYLK